MAKKEKQIPEPSLPIRLRPDQLHLIAKVRAIRSEAIDLRKSISIGSYRDEELRRLYKLAEGAGLTLYVSNPELAQRAGLGDSFYSTLVRDRRRPKLENFLRALSVIVEVADERLFDIDRDLGAADEIPDPVKISHRIKQDKTEILLLAQSLARMASEEIDKLDAERPNDPDRFAVWEKQRELLQIFGDGFAKIAAALTALESTEPEKLQKAAKVIESVGGSVNKWWLKNQDDVIDWTVRLPFLTAGVAALGWAGANMTVGTTVVAALVGGSKVLEVVSKRKSRSK